MSGVIYEAQRWRLWRRLVRDKNRNILVSVVFFIFWSEIRIFWFQRYLLSLEGKKNILVSVVFFSTAGALVVVTV